MVFWCKGNEKRDNNETKRQILFYRLEIDLTDMIDMILVGGIRIAKIMGTRYILPITFLTGLASLIIPFPI